MPEITPAGYSFIKDHVFKYWRYITISDENHNEITRLYPADARLELNEREGEQLIQLKVEFRGTDHDISLPETIAYLSIYAEDFLGNPVATDEIEPNIYMESLNDVVRLEILIEIPRISTVN